MWRFFSQYFLIPASRFVASNTITLALPSPCPSWAISQMSRTDNFQFIILEQSSASVSGSIVAPSPYLRSLRRCRRTVVICLPQCAICLYNSASMHAGQPEPGRWLGAINHLPQGLLCCLMPSAQFKRYGVFNRRMPSCGLGVPSGQN